MGRRFPIFSDKIEAGLLIAAARKKDDDDESLLCKRWMEVAIEWLLNTKEPLRSSSTSSKVMAKLAAELGLVDDVDAFQSALFAICHVYLEAAKARLDEKDLMRVMTQFSGGLAEEEKFKAVLVQCYGQAREDLLLIAAKTWIGGGTLPRYHHLDWRIDVELRRRACFELVQPTYLLRLDTTTSTSSSSFQHDDNDDADGLSSSSFSHHFESDYSTLKHIQSSLEGALSEGQKGVHCSRFARYIR